MKILIETSSGCFNTFTTKNGKNIEFDYKGKNGIYYGYESHISYLMSEATDILNQMDNCHEIVASALYLESYSGN